MAGYCTLVLYFHSLAAHENTDAHSCNIQPYCLGYEANIAFSTIKFIQLPFVFVSIANVQIHVYILYKLGYSVQEILIVCVTNMLKHQLYTRFTTCKQIIVYTQLRVELAAKYTGNKYIV